MYSHNRQIAVYFEQREPKFHERRMLDLVRENQGEFNGPVIDIGCPKKNRTDLMIEPATAASARD